MLPASRHRSNGVVRRTAPANGRGRKLTGDPAIRDAASVALVRDRHSNPRVLIGQRGTKAAFMPNRFVFPGGAIDPGDHSMILAGLPGPVCLNRLERRSAPISADRILLCAIREVWEETGLRLAERPERPLDAATVPDGWREFCAPGLLPSARGLVFFYRAITPPGRSRRFDARFLFGDVSTIPLIGDPDDFGAASGELANLRWVGLADAEGHDIPTVTRIVLKELKKAIELDGPPRNVPFRFEENGKSKLESL